MTDEDDDPCAICGKPAKGICDECSRPVCLACLAGDLCPDCADE